MGIEALKQQLTEGKITKEQFAAQVKALLDAGTVTQEEHDAAITGANGASGTNTDPPKDDFTDAQLQKIQKLMQSEADKVRTKAAADKKILEDQLDALKTEKMTEEQKAAFAREKLEKDLKDRETALNARVVELHAIEKLTDAKLPMNFKQFLVGETTEAVEANIAAFSAAWQAEIKAAVEARFKDNGGSPPGGKGGGTPSAKTWAQMTLTERGTMVKDDFGKAQALALASGERI